MEKAEIAPHETRDEQRRGWLKNGNTPGDPSTAPRCGARRKSDGQPCQAPAMANGRCRLHGGKSTGPRTPEGRARAAAANYKHGYYTKEAIAERARARIIQLFARYGLQELAERWKQ